MKCPYCDALRKEVELTKRIWLDERKAWLDERTARLEAELITAQAQQENSTMRRLLYLWNHGAEMDEDGWSALHAQTEHLISRYRGKKKPPV